MTTTDPTTTTGTSHWFDGFLMTVLLAAEDTGGTLSICEQEHRGGYGTPVHVHDREDQTLHVLSGRITAWLDPAGDRREVVLEAGGTVFLPRGVAHAFRVDADGSRLLEINTPGGFEGFHIDAGEPAPERRLPDPAAPDIERLVAAAAGYGCEIVGPPVGLE